MTFREVFEKHLDKEMREKAIAATENIIDLDVEHRKTVGHVLSAAFVWIDFDYWNSVYEQFKNTPI